MYEGDTGKKRSYAMEMIEKKLRGDCDYALHASSGNCIGPEQGAAADSVPSKVPG